MREPGQVAGQEHGRARGVRVAAADRALLRHALRLAGAQVARVGGHQALRVAAQAHRHHPCRQGLLRGRHHVQGTATYLVCKGNTLLCHSVSAYAYGHHTCR